MINSMADWSLYLGPNEDLMFWLPYIRLKWFAGPVKHTGWFTLEAELKYD